MVDTYITFLENEDKDELSKEIEALLNNETEKKKANKIEYQVVHCGGSTFEYGAKLENMVWTAMIVWEFID